MRFVLFFFILVSCEASGQGQQSAVSPAPAEETVLVVGAPEPLTLGESPRSADVIDTQQHPLAFATAQDYLRTDASVFIEQRGAGGAQADVSIRGSSFEQTLVLLNGLRINDAQTAHHNLDLPVPLEAMRAINVLQGSGSTLYGSDALAGVIDFLTATPTSTSLRLRTGVGSFGENEQSLLAGAAHGRWSELATGARSFSTGFIVDRDYRSESASSESRYRSSMGTTSILVAGSDRAFGANNFYGPYNSWERTKGWFASIHQDLGEKAEVAFGYRRHADNFVLLRTNPSFYANNHTDASWEGAVRGREEAGGHRVLFFGLEADGDSIDSNNLGLHARNQEAGYLDLDIRSTKRWGLSAGIRGEMVSGRRFIPSPDVAGSLWVSEKVKLRCSGGYGFRLPTYTDLYYRDPTTVGNPNLKPESSWSGDVGADFYASSNLMASFTIFYSRQRHAIDYVRAGPSQPWQAANLVGLRFAGTETSATWQPTRNQSLKLGWTTISGAQSALHGLESEYVFNYPVNNASLEWWGKVKQSYLLRTRVQIAQRYHESPYPVWDVEAVREHGWLHPYLRMANLSNTGYQEIAGVPMPGRSFQGGLEIELIRH